jgi:sulfur carrier protein
MTSLSSPTATLSIHVNGQPHETRAAHLQDLLLERGHPLAGAFACAINNQFVPRVEWPQRALQPGDRVDVIAPITGG